LFFFWFFTGSCSGKLLSVGFIVGRHHHHLQLGLRGTRRWTTGGFFRPTSPLVPVYSNNVERLRCHINGLHFLHLHGRRSIAIIAGPLEAGHHRRGTNWIPHRHQPEDSPLRPDRRRLPTTDAWTPHRQRLPWTTPHQRITIGAARIKKLPGSHQKKTNRHLGPGTSIGSKLPSRSDSGEKEALGSCLQRPHGTGTYNHLSYSFIPSSFLIRVF